jgi:hypothetical protein
MFNDRASITDFELNQRIGEIQNLEEKVDEEEHELPQDCEDPEVVEISSPAKVDTNRDGSKSEIRISTQEASFTKQGP